MPEYFRYKTFPMSLPQLLHVEERLRRLRRKVPDLPTTETLVLRAAMILSRDFNTVLERQLKPAGLTEAEFRLLTGLLFHTCFIAHWRGRQRSQTPDLRRHAPPSLRRCPDVRWLTPLRAS